jgi:outer membrane beta-barrel protein
LIGAKLEYHFLDYLSLGGDFGYGVSGLDTGIKSELEQQYTSSGESATWNDDLSKRIPDLQFAGDVRLSLTPFTGKFSLFSKWFFDYDMFVFAGLGLAKNKLPSGGNVSDDVKAATEDGLRLGPAFGFGAHIFINSFFSIGLEFKDLIYADNQSGGDLTRGRSSAELELAKSTNSSYPILVDGDDKNFLNHFFFGLNFTFYLPPTVEISR